VVFALAAASTAATVALAFALHRLAGTSGDVAAPQTADYPGAAALHGAPVPAVEFRPRLVEVESDVPSAYHESCIQEILRPEITTCVYGKRHAGRRIAVVGDSHAIHWLPALQALVDRLDLQVVALTKTTCAFSLIPPYHPKLKRAYTECSDWTKNVIAYLGHEKFDLVIVSMSAYHVLAADLTPKESRERLAVGIRQALDAVARTGNPLVVLRPTPTQRKSPVDCVAAQSPPYSKCAARRSLAVFKDAVTMAATDGGHRLVDMTDLFCPGDRCPPIIGNVFVYRDRHHITASYMRTLAPFLAERLGLSREKQ
jgi:hypothetical protein